MSYLNGKITALRNIGNMKFQYNMNSHREINAKINGLLFASPCVSQINLLVAHPNIFKRRVIKPDS